MGFFDKLFGSKNKQNMEKKPVENEVPDEVKELKSRDKNQNAIYFYNFLQRIKPTAEWLLNGYYEAQKNNNKIGMKNWAKGLSEGLYTKPSMWYSMGAAINEDWQTYYMDNIKYYQECISKDLINGSYQFSSKILSIGILLNINKSVFKKISERYVEEGYEDFILDSMIHSQYPQHPISATLQFPNEKYIQKLSEILKSDSKQEAEAIVKDTLENYFDTKENLQAVYDSHKTEFYIGYWAWELGALVKIMGLNDSSFKDHNYYPYDLVHWR